MLSNLKVIEIKERGMDTDLQRLEQLALALQREHDVSMAINLIVETLRGSVLRSTLRTLGD